MKVRRFFHWVAKQVNSLRQIRQSSHMVTVPAWAWAGIPGFGQLMHTSSQASTLRIPSRDFLLISSGLEKMYVTLCLYYAMFYTKSWIPSHSRSFPAATSWSPPSKWVRKADFGWACRSGVGKKCEESLQGAPRCGRPARYVL